ncbi:hypothetical protein [Nocardia sp. NPDC051832]|uniref:hypothetical protein n=1 Tax=Nocardia sp. NPDC051832 TaxID=3155673 RepID=UPI00343C0C5C
MSGVDQRVESLSWPAEWKRNDKRERKYRARGSDGVHVVWVDHDGVGEEGLLVPSVRSSKLQGILFTVFGGLFTAAVLASVPFIVIDGAWDAIGGVLCVGAFAVPTLLLGIHSWRHAGSKHLTGLRLTPTRVIFGSYDGSHVAMRWEQISRVRPFLNAGTSRQWWNAFAIEVHDLEAVLSHVGPKALRLHRMANGPAAVTLHDNHLAVHPLLAYHLVRYYFDNPADRPNITQALA